MRDNGNFSKLEGARKKIAENLSKKKECEIFEQKLKICDRNSFGKLSIDRDQR
jgi:hypothetical protein